MHRKRNLVFLLLAPVALIAIVWILNRAPALQSVPTQTGKLSNGSAVALKKITYGKKHQCFLDRPGPFIQMVRDLPISYQNKLGFPQPGFQFESSNGHENIGIWATTPFPVPMLRLVTVSSNGHQTMKLTFQTASMYSGMTAGQGLSCWELKNFPRREKQFTVRLEEQLTNNTWRPVVEWQLANPDPKPFPS